MDANLRKLRDLAEHAVSEQPDSMRKLWTGEIDKLVHELRIHETELRMQNDELRRTQCELEAEREKYQDLFEFAPVGYFVLDRAGRITDVNLTGSAMLNMERKSMYGTPLFLYISDECRSQFDHHFKSVFESEATQSCELKLKRQGDEPLQALLETKHAIDRSGYKILKVTVSDISSRKQAERQELTIHILNLLGTSETRKSMIRDILLAIKTFSGLEAAGIRLKSGEDFPYFETAGFPPKFVEAERYLCARNQAGDLFRDATGNPVLECMCGNVICGRTKPSLPFFTQNGSFWTNSTSRLLASTTEEERQTRTRNRCHGEGYESVCLIPIRAGLKTLGLLQLNDRRTDMLSHDLVCFFEDITGSIGYTLEILDARDRLREKQTQLARTGRLATLGEMAAGVAHELTQPLALARLYAETLEFGNSQKHNLDSDDMEKVSSILRSIDWAANIIRHMKSYTKKSDALVHAWKFRLKDPAKNSLDFFRRQFKKNRIRLESEFEDDMPMVEGDEQKFEQVVVNLMSNARYAVEERGKTEMNYEKRVAMRVFHDTARNAGILEIEDNGIGMGETEKEKCRAPFFTTDVGKGTGLGLTISHSIIREMNGTLEIEIEKGVGTVMRVVIPSFRL